MMKNQKTQSNKQKLGFLVRSEQKVVGERERESSNETEDQKGVLYI